jgi:hypothetical protein
VETLLDEFPVPLQFLTQMHGTVTMTVSFKKARLFSDHQYLALTTSEHVEE